MLFLIALLFDATPYFQSLHGEIVTEYCPNCKNIKIWLSRAKDSQQNMTTTLYLTTTLNHVCVPGLNPQCLHFCWYCFTVC